MKKISIIAAMLLLVTLTPAMSKPTLFSGSKASKPEAAAKGLYDAWKRNDRRAALRVASTSAVNKVFRTRYSGPGWEFNGCEKRAGGYDCFYRYEGGGVNMRVTGGAAAGYRVRSVSFIAD
ncbi:MAG TPA: hypothetical protein VGC66_25405 [Pyrinomonadaceae bacterium]